MNKKFWSVGMIIPLAAATVVSTAPSAAAAVPRIDPVGLGLVRDIGICSGRSDITLTAREREARLRDRIALDVRIVTNRAGQQWRVRLLQNGQPLVARVALARPDFGRPVARRAAVVEVREVALDRRGVDRFVARAINVNTGETCTAQVVVREDRLAQPPFRPPLRPPFRPPFRP